MKFLLNSIANIATKVAGGVSNFCVFYFFEPELPESLKEE